MGCGSSKLESPRATEAGVSVTGETTTASRDSTKVYQLPSGGFASQESPLFKEYLELMKPGEPTMVEGGITADDALLVIDMQRDFVPKSSSNPDGGRFGAPEGDHIILPCVQLIEHFVKCGAMVAATRDYHPHDHVSFMKHGGPFPAHCVQGTPGAKFLPAIAAAMAAGRATLGDRVCVAFKAMHEDVDSFGGLPYKSGGDGRIGKRDLGLKPESGIACMMGCAEAPWTGSLILKQ